MRLSTHLRIPSDLSEIFTPPQAVQFLGMLKDDDKAAMTEEIHREAERLFKLIGEAYNVLSNPSKVRRPVGEVCAVRVLGF